MRQNEKKAIRFLILMAVVLLWGLYLCDAEMSGYGMYHIFSYSVHEAMTLFPYLCLAATIGWLLYELIKGYRSREWKPRAFFCTLLLLLCLLQGSYLYARSKTISTTVVTQIEQIDREQGKIVIRAWDNSVELDCPMLVTGILEAGQKQYVITYEWKESRPDTGTLYMVQAVES